ncbi:MAG: AAA family ATPase [Candidatus Thiodiazotropha sp. (ex Lucinoma borealis)]|nr:AAA family ATPase [Candidatus Thiodiazotropha sp. (ex Lucinoma borealis)]
MPTQLQQPSITIPVGSINREWDGMGCVSLQGDIEVLQQAGIGQVSADFRTAYVVLHNQESDQRCGAIVKKLTHTPNTLLEADPSLASDLSASVGSLLELSALTPTPANSVRLSVLNTDLGVNDIERLCRIYLSRQPLYPGQHKQVYLLTGEKITLKILEVLPQPLCIYTDSTVTVVETSTCPAAGGGLDEVGGLEQEKRILRERILLPITQPDFFARHGIRPPRGILLYGPPGAGKTMIARALASENNATFFELSGADAFTATYGESEKAINEIFARASKKTPAIILIDEIDALGSTRHDTRGELERRVVTTLLTAMDGLRQLGNVIVVGTTNMPDRLDPALRRPGRFDYEIHVGVPDRQGREDILHKKTAHMATAPDVDLCEIAHRTHGFVGADLMLLCREAAFSALTTAHRPESLFSSELKPAGNIQVNAADFEQALRRVKPSALREFAVEVPGHLDWDCVGGLSALKSTLAEEVIQGLKNPETFERVGIRPVRGILLYGPPGTGKTLIARVIANQADANFIAIKGPELLSKWFGESEQRIRHLFSKARESSPCIIFFDEIDAISGSRGHDTSGGADRIVNQLLTEMDGFDTSKHVCVIGATNRVDTIDEALLRPGRFDHQILVPLPDEAGLEEIYRIHCRNKPLLDDVDFAALARRSHHFSGAHVAEVCRRAALATLRKCTFDADRARISHGHLLEAVNAVCKTIHDLDEPKIGFMAAI